MAHPLFEQLADLYARMVSGYDRVAARIGLTCAGCPDNCCNSYFQHHTHIEWAYLREGFDALPPDDQKKYLARAEEYIRQCREEIARGRRPCIMCPLNDEGLCMIYAHRPMICRMHGVPNRLTRPDGRTLQFPGCFRSQELCADSSSAPMLDRTDFYRELAGLEMAFMGDRLKSFPRVNHSLAEMLTTPLP
jgi:hypothetical protein